MFCSLKNVLNENWYSNSENHIITFYTPNETLQYQVFSVYQTSLNDYDTSTYFDSDESFENFLTKIKNNSVYNFNVEVDKHTQVLTLSTCANNNKYRVVLHAKKIS